MLERTDWEDWINKERENIQKLEAELTQQEDELNQQIYGLFDLTDDEVGLLEKAARHY